LKRSGRVKWIAGGWVVASYFEIVIGPAARAPALVSPRPVVVAAERTFDTIIETYLGPNRTMHEVLDDVHRGGFDFLIQFGEACREDLARD